MSLPHLIVFYYIMFGCYLIEACSFTMRDRKEADLGRRGSGEELGRVGGGETIIKIYCNRKEPIFNGKRMY